MKRTFTLLLSAIFFSLSAFGQDIKVKKEIVYVDEVPTLKMVGDCGIFKTLRYSFLTMSGDTLFKMKDKFLSFDDPRFETINWHEFNFKGIDKVIRVQKNSTYINDKQVAKFLYSFQPLLITNGNLDSDALSGFIEKNDITAKITADTAFNHGFERLQKSAVLTSSLARDRNKEVIVVRPAHPERYDLQGFGTYSVYEIWQDRIIIGIAVQVVKQEFSETKTACYFMKKLVEPFDYNGYKNEYGMVAYIDNIDSGFLETLFIKETVSFKAPLQTGNKTLDYARHLVQIGAL
ncbi:MAG TPA: hypothetical protein PKH02_10905 [Bacteroidales bacterium]|nr:hypothetical protein [Bacteroidales bacterium]HPT12281.1 hypothetical protein [Bacteroidales bacterium]